MRFKYNCVLLMCLIVFVLLSGCSSHIKNNNKMDYCKLTEEYSAKYNYAVKEQYDNQQEFFVKLQKNSKDIELRIIKNNETHSAYYDLSCSCESEQLVEYYDILEFVNGISKKQYSSEFVDNVINAKEPYYNCEKYYQTEYYKDYQLCKIDYLDLTPDYCLQYIRYDDLFQTISFSGFTK